jgi:PAS domain S-box-containing protein
MLTALYLFFPPTLSFAAPMTAFVGLVLFGATGIAAGMLGSSRLRALRRAESAAQAASEALRRADEEAVLAAVERLRAEEETARAGVATTNAAAFLNQKGQTETALRESEARFRAIAHSSPLGIYLTDPEGECVYTNPAYQRISGLTAIEAEGAGWRRALHPDDRDRVSSEWYEAARRQLPFQSEHRFRHGDGTVVRTRVNAAEIRNGDVLVGYVGLVEDVSQKAETEASLRASEERYRAFIEQTSEGIWRFELAEPIPAAMPEDQQIERFYATAFLAECNDAVARMYGFSRSSELVGARLGDLLPRSDPANIEYLRAFIRSGYRLMDAESHEVDRDGRPRYFLNNLIGILAGGNLLRAWGTQRDITESRQAEAARQASEARFRSVYQSNMIGIAFWDGEQVTDANDALLDMLGYTRADIQEGLLRHGRLTPPGHEEADRRAFEEVRIRGACVPYEKEFCRKDGAHVPVLVGGAILQNDAQDAVFFVLDLSERKRAEERLRHSERIEVVGQLAGGMAHEANNQMTVILGATEFILRHPGLAESVRQDVEYIRAAAERTTSITRQLLAFSRRQILLPRVVDVNQVVTNLESILRRTLIEHQSLSLALSPDAGPVRADPVQLDQILLNLTINARDAMPRGGTLTIETRSTYLSDQDVTPETDVPVMAGRYTALIVSDTGHGMDSETLKHVFEPFFTTKGVGQGSGLGLATVFGIVKQSGGHIVAESQPGLGTSLKLFFPSVQQESEGAESAAATDPEVEPIRESRTILLVEDDPLVRNMVERSLAESGFRIVAASTGTEALALALTPGERIDTVLTDLAMPDMGGRELARRLAEQRPGLPIVFMSGYTDDDVIRRGLLDDGLPFLEKPLTPAALVRQMREVMDHPSDGNVKRR